MGIMDITDTAALLLPLFISRLRHKTTTLRTHTPGVTTVHRKRFGLEDRGV
ncbi:predicted protein [Plenodomus lingam JN3]|uniref:Predicted protein n=1 Tax=Leptosphaeria maculans (strain JN3 / isolate v23.1.3 / race Av1-4-5-6-7-8) TaxID=985895 RepID=E4ZXE2_LEPMJ|nr:predicted protein [Plenodomus lingam JN3]CBX95352.1 predicted protein [Plenodomus lingam JN3]